MEEKNNENTSEEKNIVINTEEYYEYPSIAQQAAATAVNTLIATGVTLVGFAVAGAAMKGLDTLSDKMEARREAKLKARQEKTEKK